MIGMTGDWLAAWRRTRSHAVVRLVEGFHTPRTPVERLALAELRRRDEMTLAALVTATTYGLVGQAIGGGGAALDVGIWGPRMFRFAVERELDALQDVLWRYVRRPSPRSDRQDLRVRPTGLPPRLDVAT